MVKDLDEYRRQAQSLLRKHILPALKELLGHASIEMTQRYAHLAPDYLGREVARLNFTVPVEGKVLALHGRAG